MHLINSLCVCVRACRELFAKHKFNIYGFSVCVCVCVCVCVGNILPNTNLTFMVLACYHSSQL